MPATDFPFVPGFRVALDKAADARDARDRLVDLASAGSLSRRARAMIALTVTRQSAVDYCIWAQECAARDAGLTGEEIVFASAGTALARKDAAITRLARQVAEQGIFSERDIRAMPQEPLLTRAEMLEVAACVGATVIENCILMGVAPEGARTASA